MSGGSSLKCGGVRLGMTANQEGTGLGVLGNEQRGVGDHAFGGLAFGEFATDRMGPDTADTVDRKNDRRASLQRELSEGFGGVAAGYVERCFRCCRLGECQTAEQETDPQHNVT